MADLKDFIDYWDDVVRQWLDNGADISKFTGDAAEQCDVIKAINGTVGKKKPNFQLQTHHLPNPYWGDPRECSIVIVNYNPAGGPEPNRHITINCKNCTSFSEMTQIKFVDKYKYSDLACTPVMFEPVVGKAWFSDPATGFVGYKWWQEKQEWIAHLVECICEKSICENVKDKEKRSPFSIELCAWHSKSWKNNSWIDSVDSIIKNRFVTPLYLAMKQSLWNSNVKIAVCIGSEFNFGMLEKFFGQGNIMDISQHISNNISVSGYTVRFDTKGGNIHVEEHKENKNRNYRVFMLTDRDDSGNRYFILNTHYRGGNSHPAKHFWNFEKELINII